MTGRNFALYTNAGYSARNSRRLYTNGLDRVSRLDVQHLDAVADQLLQLVRPPGQRREGGEVHGHHGLDAKQRHRLGGSLRAHRVEAADGQERRVELVELGDDSHVTEHVGVAGEIDGVAVLELDDQTARLAAVDDLVAVGDAARMLRVHERHLDAVDVDGAALVGADERARVKSLRAEPGGDLEVADHLRLVLLGDLERVCDVVEVAVRDEHEVAAIDLLHVGRGAGVVHDPRVDEDLLAFGAAHPPGPVPDPREADLRVKRHPPTPV